MVRVRTTPIVARPVSTTKVTFNMKAHRLLPLVVVPLLACSSSSGGSGTPSSANLQIVTVSGGALTAVAGDGLALKVVQIMADGSTQDLPSETTVTWSGPPTVTASSPDGMPADNAYPATGGASPVGIWVANPSRADRAADLSGVLFVLDAGFAGGSISVTAAVSGGASGSATALVSVSAAPMGDATHGAMLYGESGANCAECHGVTGKGTPMADGDGMYTIDAKRYSFPAPGIDGEMGNAAAEWSSALFAISSRADLDDEAVSLRLPMPDWLGSRNPATGKVLSTQDFADIFAYLKTQQ
jgi:mono/diheme cytochrome c family protein